MQEHVTGPENELSATPFKRGKVKDIYELDREQLLFVFTDRVAAYDVVLPSTIPRKGEVLCKLAAFWFDYLKVPHHMLRVEDTNRMVVRRLKMIPVEAVVRGYLYGSLYERLMRGDIVASRACLGGEASRAVFRPDYKVGCEGRAGLTGTDRGGG